MHSMLLQLHAQMKTPVRQQQNASRKADWRFKKVPADQVDPPAAKPSSTCKLLPQIVCVTISAEARLQTTAACHTSSSPPYSTDPPPLLRSAAHKHHIRAKRAALGVGTVQKGTTERTQGYATLL